jgi:hypothetical protein
LIVGLHLDVVVPRLQIVQPELLLDSEADVRHLQIEFV